MKFPAIRSQTIDGEHLRYELDITNDLIWFKGHFPGQPVLPGVVQLDWAIKLAQQHFGHQDVPREVLRLKFKSVVVPPKLLVLSLSRTSASDATFEYTSKGEIFSEGKLRFAGDRQ